jgi:hypothetical protein
VSGILIAFYVIGALVAFMVSFIARLEDDHILTVGRTIFWPLYAVKLILVAAIRAAKELAA